MVTSRASRQVSVRCVARRGRSDLSSRSASSATSGCGCAYRGGRQTGNAPSTRDTSQQNHQGEHTLPRPLKIATLTFSFVLLVVSHAHAGHINNRNGISHVLLISIDGMHAADYTNCIQGGYCPTLEALGATGANYTRTSASKPSDSFPGLMAMVTGGTPRTVGAFYDVA